MSRYRTPEEIYHYDRFKLLVLLLLLAGLLGLILFSDEQGLRLGLTGVPGTGTELAEATLEPTAESPVATPQLTAPQPGTDLVAGEVIFAGTGEPEMAVRVLVDGQLGGETPVDAGGNWAIPILLATGSPQVVLETVDANGGVVSQSGPYAFNVVGGEALPGEGGDTGTEPPDATIATPLLIAPQPGTGLTAGEVIFAGTGEPSMTVRVLVDGQVGGETSIDAGGNWAMPVILPSGSPEVLLETVDANGGVVSQSGPYVFDVASGEEVLPGEGGDTGAGPVEPGIDDNSGPNPLTGMFTLSGTAPAGSTVAATVNGEPAGTTVADDQGNWSVDLVAGGGPMTVQIQVTDPAGTVTTSDPVTIEDPSGAPDLSLPGLVVPGPDAGGMILNVPSGSFTWNGTGLPNTTVDVIIDGQSAGVAPVNEDGNWTIVLDLPPGAHTVQLITVDPTTGQPLGTTQEIPFTVVSETRPTVDIPTDGWVSGSNEISGTAPAGTMLTVYVNGLPVADVTTGADGTWSTTFDLSTGSSVIDVRLVGENGSIVFGSEPLSVLVVGEEPTVADVLVQAGQFNILLGAAQATGLDGTLATEGPYTLFAPPDQAFTALPAGVLDSWLANPQYLSTLLLHHIVPGEVSAEAAVQAGTLTTAANDTLTISREGTLVRVDSASVLFPDIDASNGVVQVIDQVLLPTLPPGVQGPVIDTAGVPTFTGPLLTVVGAAQPGYTILVQLNGQNFGQIATVDSTGFWLVSQDVTPGRYEIVAYMYDPTGIMVGISDPVTLLVR